MNKRHLALALLALAGCQYGEVVVSTCPGGCEKDRYLAECREWAMDTKLGTLDLVKSPRTTQRRSSQYEIVYVDADYLSYKLKEFEGTLIGRGSECVFAGTISRKTGEKAPLSDFLSEKELSEMQGSENFYLADDGLHLFFGNEEKLIVAPLRETREK